LRDTHGSFHSRNAVSLLLFSNAKVMLRTLKSAALSVYGSTLA
jgi:hypothetical protein